MKNINNSNKNSHKLFAGLIALVLVAGMASPAFADSTPEIEPNLDAIIVGEVNPLGMPDIIFDNDGATPDPNSGNDMTRWIQAEDFAFDESTPVHDVHFIIIEFDGDAWDGSLDYYIFADDGGIPGNILASGSAQNLGTLDLGVGPFGPRTEIWFDLEEDFIAGGGVTYHLGLHANTNDFIRDDVYWETANGGFGNPGTESDGGTMDNWVTAAGSRNHYFLLSGGDKPIGGVSAPVSTTALVIAAAQANMGLWSLALVGMVAAGAAITYKVKSNKSKQ